MGGRKSYSANALLGSGRATNQRVEKLQSTLKEEDNEKAVLQLLQVLASSDPALSTILLTAKILTLAYKIYTEVESEYKESGDYATAVPNAILKVAGDSIGNKKQIIIENGVKICWNKVKEENDIDVKNSEVDEVVTSVATETILEILQ
ncbi:hypothetical protein FTO70_06560 [Methanosarcina sp. KYL-1]|uniref:hypothetical protein n=1 Tax=Methanosarcina sp. KYL-1 TaxID=2602068 RepID=UPI002101C13C|nr:hypothetical protein [Methanosarcina sp. KYL-1]MCQ1535357.1 hypothetical protein [Methanosarcina sp. KYL-1]